MKLTSSSIATLLVVLFNICAQKCAASEHSPPILEDEMEEFDQNLDLQYSDFKFSPNKMRNDPAKPVPIAVPKPTGGRKGSTATKSLIFADSDPDVEEEIEEEPDPNLFFDEIVMPAPPKGQNPYGGPSRKLEFVKSTLSLFLFLLYLLIASLVVYLMALKFVADIVNLVEAGFGILEADSTT